MRVCRPSSQSRLHSVQELQSDQDWGTGVGNSGSSSIRVSLVSLSPSKSSPDRVNLLADRYTAVKKKQLIKQCNLRKKENNINAICARRKIILMQSAQEGK